MNATRSVVVFALVCLLATVSARSLLQATYKTLGKAVIVASTSPQTTTLIAAVKAAGVANSLTSDKTWTILAPTNEAFAKRLEASFNITPQQLLQPQNKDLLVKILSLHVVPTAALTSNQLKNGQKLQTILKGSAPLTVIINNGKVSFKSPGGNTATVTVANIKAGSSVVHVVDDVILPSKV
eukprot:GHRR01007189.1.p1 GENE.GHRR01007189.1~~GHRR01007189.1.p1  ORF type:complete len:182 (-),score=48.79 GHRR01007189.1:1189-1734(-)